MQRVGQEQLSDLASRQPSYQGSSFLLWLGPEKSRLRKQREEEESLISGGFSSYNLIAPGVVLKIQPKEIKSALTFQFRWEKKREAFMKYKPKMTFL